MVLRFKMKFILFVIMFLMIISLIIINNHDLKISEKEDLHTFLGTYADWFSVFFSNVKTITGNIVNQNWLPE
jgi:hypothetical protein